MERSLEVKHAGVMNRFFTGLLCVFGGWCVLVLSCHLHFYVKRQTRLAETAARFAEMGRVGWQPSPPSWWTLPGFITLSSIPYVAAVGFLCVSPLFLAIPPGSGLWKWPLAVAVFGALGALAMFGLIQLQLAPIMNGAIGLASLTGAATGFFCAMAKRRHARAETKRGSP